MRLLSEREDSFNRDGNTIYSRGTREFSIRTSTENITADCSDIVKKYDSAGRLLVEISLPLHGKGDSTVYYFDIKGNPVGFSDFDGEGNEYCNRVTFNEKNQKVSSTYLGTTGTSKSIYDYDTSGNIERQSVYKNDTLVWQEIFRYNAQNKMISCRYFNANSTGVDIDSIAYNEAGDTLVKFGSYTDPNRNYTEHYYYNKHSQLDHIERCGTTDNQQYHDLTYFDQQRKLLLDSSYIDNRFGSTSARHTYDSHGNETRYVRRETVKQGTGSFSKNHPIAKREIITNQRTSKYHYDKYGNATRIEIKEDDRRVNIWEHEYSYY